MCCARVVTALLLSVPQSGSRKRGGDSLAASASLLELQGVPLPQAPLGAGTRAGTEDRLPAFTAPADGAGHRPVRASLGLGYRATESETKQCVLRSHAGCALRPGFMRPGRWLRVAGACL